MSNPSTKDDLAKVLKLMEILDKYYFNGDKNSQKKNNEISIEKKTLIINNLTAALKIINHVLSSEMIDTPEDIEKIISELTELLHIATTDTASLNEVFKNIESVKNSSIAEVITLLTSKIEELNEEPTIYTDNQVEIMTGFIENLENLENLKNLENLEN